MGDFRKFSVIVIGSETGSGCIIQAMSKDFDYLLTAKHICSGKTNQEIKVTGHWLNDDDERININIPLYDDLLYIHDNKKVDALILKISKGFVSESIYCSAFGDDKQFQLCGYPNTRLNDSDKFKQVPIDLLNRKEHGYFEAQINAPITYTRPDVIGFSGSGIYNNQNNSINLVAIQSRMSTKDDNELHGRVDIMPIGLFDEIIEKDSLPPIIPVHLSCFKEYKELIFKMEDCWSPDHIINTRTILRGLSNDIIEQDITPHQIKQKFEGLLLVNGQKHDVLFEKKLWESWLEFLIIYRIAVNKNIDLGAVFNEKRLIYSNSKKPWSQEIKSILRSNFKGLKKNGSVIVSSPTSSDKTVITGDILDDITRASDVPSEDLIIDEGIDHPLKAYKFIHLYAFSKECIISKSKEYSGYSSMNKNELLEKLKTEYARIFEL